MTQPAVSIYDLPESLQECVAIVIREEDLAKRIAATGIGPSCVATRKLLSEAE